MSERLQYFPTDHIEQEVDEDVDYSIPYHQRAGLKKVEAAPPAEQSTPKNSSSEDTESAS